VRDSSGVRPAKTAVAHVVAGIDIDTDVT